MMNTISMKALASSDHHGVLGVPPRGRYDFFFGVGDHCPNWAWDWHIDPPNQFNWLEQKFIPWINKIDAKHKVIVAGNHDNAFQSMKKEVKNLFTENGIILLENESVVLDNAVIYGFPYTRPNHNLPRWAYWADEANLKDLFLRNCPPNVNVILSHGPIYGILDIDEALSEREHLGSTGLAEIWEEHEYRELSHFLFGHVHHSYPSYRRVSDVAFYNCAGVFHTFDI